MRTLTIIVALSLALATPRSASAQAQGGPGRHKLKAGAQGALCLECHATFVDVLKKPSVHTPVRSKDCTGCHNPHASDHGKLLAAQPNATCALCHGDIVSKDALSRHKPVIEKGCATCHDPHASGFKNNLVKQANELCAECHKAVTDRAGKSKFKHRPVEQGCGNCHDPHGSAKSKALLKQAVPELCVKCHKTEGQIFVKAHAGYQVGKSNCSSCHDAHGSDKRGMLYNRVHSPVAKAMCNQCHELPNSPKKFTPKVGAPDLCRGCHAQKLNDILAKSRIHWPVVEGASCLTCHNPHASKAPGLVRGTTISTCGACHSDTIKRGERSPTQHTPVVEGQCGACHDPHSGEAPLLLANADVITGCGACHDWLKHSSHPMGEKVKDPRNKNLTIQCLSCHRSHGTEYKHMMPYPNTSELCTKCHSQYRR